MIGLLQHLPLGPIELGCHPALQVDFDTMHHEEHVKELHALCDPRLRAAVDRLGIRLVSFDQVEE